MARYAFNGTIPNTNAALNALNRYLKMTNDNVGNIQGGGGQAATHEIVEKATKWMIDKVTSNYVTYNYTNSTLKKPNANSFNCASFIITAYFAVGLDINATWCPNMIPGFTAKGFTWIEMEPSIPASKCLRGDILLDPHTHTQVYIGSNQDVNCGSTPGKVMPHAVDNYGRGWKGILRML